MFENFFGLVFVGSFKTNDQRHVQTDLGSGSNNAFRQQIAPQKAAENINQNSLDPGIGHNDFYAGGYFIFVHTALNV